MKNQLEKKVIISAALATYNEEFNIVDCIQSLKQVAGEIVVVDGSSQDRTAELAKKLGAKVIKTENKKMFHINKNMAIASCKGEWIILMDADERITPELAKEIKELVKGKHQRDGYWINRKNWFLGGFLTKGGAYPDPVIRLFKKGKGKLPEVSVHEQVAVTGPVGHLKNDLLHLADPNFTRYLERANRYTDFTAQKLEEKKVGKNLTQIIFYMLIKPTITFMNIFIRHGGFKDGYRGFIWALFSGAHHFYAYSKYLTKNSSHIG